MATYKEEATKAAFDAVTPYPPDPRSDQYRYQLRMLDAAEPFIRDQVLAEAREALVSYAALHALYTHAPTIVSDNDAGPDVVETEELRVALEAVRDEALATLSPSEDTTEAGEGGKYSPATRYWRDAVRKAAEEFESRAAACFATENRHPATKGEGEGFAKAADKLRELKPDQGLEG